MAGARDPPLTAAAAAASAGAASSAAAATTPAAGAGAATPGSRLVVQRGAAAPGLLLIDMPHLQEGLAHMFPHLVSSLQGGGPPLAADADESLALLLPSVLTALEAAYGTRFKKR